MSEEEVFRRLKKNLELNEMFKLNFFNNLFKKKNSNPYKGNVNDNTFTIQRNIVYKPSLSILIIRPYNFLNRPINIVYPVILGEVNRDFNGTLVKVKMRVKFVIIAVYLIIFSLVLNLLMLEVSQNINRMSNLYFTLFVFIFVYFLALFGFKLECNKSKQDLQKMFDAEIIEE